jgi:hypothetical protein
MYTTSLASVPELGNAWISTGGWSWLWNESGVSISYDGGHHWYDFPATGGAKFRAMSWVNKTCGWAGSYSLSETEWGVYKFAGNLLPWPIQLSGDTIPNGVYLSWSNPITNNLNITALGYNVYRDGIKLNSGPVLETNYTDHPASTGNYEYCVTALYEEGESNSSCIEVFVDVIDMVNEKEKQTMQLYPNPFSTSLTIQFEQESHGPNEIAIFNHLGQLVELMDQGSIQHNKFHYIWDASDLPDGMYFIQCTAGNDIATRKVVKVK